MQKCKWQPNQKEKTFTNMIDFNYTEEQNGVITFVNMQGEAVKRYPLSDLEKYVEKHKLNWEYSHEVIGGSGMVCDPNTDFEEVLSVVPISIWIDDNFDTVTKDFYIANNPTEHVAKHNYAYSKEANL